MEMRKWVPELVFEMGGIIKAIMAIYDEITGILEELICKCYFDDVESIIEAITTMEHYDIQDHDYCEKLLKLSKDFEDEHNKLENIFKEIMKEQFS